MTDPLRHPDLIEMSRRLRDRFNEVLAAEQEAAATTRRRQLTLRERLLDAEDRGDRVTMRLAAGTAIEGTLGAVGADHVVVEQPAGSVVIAFRHLAAIETAR